ncbi:hypothetical protein EYF80_049190 [Liparis tanakae]|uniref:Uncharacterized protein n=1 Tax=Liparis tanakae TaxID=230148 RepID=A0A4Z2FI83_9TELE|nr:hypothetical protein EYF80_049190 [Liparis tanakae]
MEGRVYGFSCRASLALAPDKDIFHSEPKTNKHQALVFNGFTRLDGGATGPRLPCDLLGPTNHWSVTCRQGAWLQRPSPLLAISHILGIPRFREDHKGHAYNVNGPDTHRAVGGPLSCSGGAPVLQALRGFTARRIEEPDRHTDVTHWLVDGRSEASGLGISVRREGRS